MASERRRDPKSQECSHTIWNFTFLYSIILNERGQNCVEKTSLQYLQLFLYNILLTNNIVWYSLQCSKCGLDFTHINFTAWNNFTPSYFTAWLDFTAYRFHIQSEFFSNESEHYPKFWIHCMKFIIHAPWPWNKFHVSRLNS